MNDNSRKGKWIKIIAIIILLASMLGDSGCSLNNASPKNASLNNASPKNAGSKSSAQSRQKSVRNLNVDGLNKPLATPPIAHKQVSAATLPLTSDHGIQYVEAKPLFDLLNFQSLWDPKSSTIYIGDNDANFVLKVNSTQAQREDETIQLPSPLKIINQRLYIPVTALHDLFQQDMTFAINKNQLAVGSSDSSPSISPKTDSYLNFGDDPNDPYKKSADSFSPASEDIRTFSQTQEGISFFSSFPDNSESVPVALRNINMGSLVRLAQRYLGVKYAFAAKPYPISGRFDCSSFTKYIFAKYGVYLPRTARAQATYGITVSRSRLRVGDLMFFYVPGRFRTNKTVGHVGIYIGGGRMISANNQPKNGVQYSNINNRYWRHVFIKAKRVAV